MMTDDRCVAGRPRLGGGEEKDDVDGVLARCHQRVHAVVAALVGQDAHRRQGSHVCLYTTQHITVNNKKLPENTSKRHREHARFGESPL